MLDAVIDYNGEPVEVKFHWDYEPAEPLVNFAERAQIFSVMLDGVDITKNISKSARSYMEQIVIEYHYDKTQQFIEEIAAYQQQRNET